MAQWVNRLRNNIFVNQPPLPLSCEISGALHLAQTGLTAGRLTDEIQADFEIFIPAGFSDKAHCKVDFKARNFGKPYDF